MNYQELKAKHTKELNEFKGIFFAFSSDQFKEGMEKVGLNENNRAKIFSLGGGGYILKSRGEAFSDLFKEHSNAMEKALLQPDFLMEALSYELANHEYCITYNFEDAFSALGLTLEDILSVEGGKGILKQARESALQEC